MGWFSRRRGQGESRAVSYQDLWSTGADVTAITAGTVNTALRLSPLYAAVRLIADQGASLPLKGYRATDGLSAPMATQPELLRDPCPGVSPFTWKQQALTSMLLRGNAYGYITEFSGTAARTVVWLNPSAVTVDETSGQPIYRLNGQMIEPSRIIHIPGLTVAGSCVGVAPITAFRTLIETGLAAQQFSRDWFANGGPVAPGSHLRNTERTIPQPEADAIKDRYKASVRSGDVLVTGSDWELKQLAVTADDAAFVQTSKLTATQIAAIYGVPPEKIGGETGSSLTYSTVELNNLDFVTFGLRPWLVRIEEAISRVLPQPQYARFNIDALLRADTKTRYEAHQIALAAGFLTVDEVRQLEGRPAIPVQATPGDTTEGQA